MNSTDTTTRVEVKHLHHSHDPDTSRIAAEELSDMDAVREAIIELLEEEPRTVTELTAAYCSLRQANGWPFLADLHNIARRTSDLHQADRIYDTGERRATRLGRPSVVWAVKEAA